MKLSKIISNGRITIPTKLRKKYWLTPGRQIKLELTEDSIRVIPLLTPKEIENNTGFLETNGKLLKVLMEEKKIEREL